MISIFKSAGVFLLAVTVYVCVSSEKCTVLHIDSCWSFRFRPNLNRCLEHMTEISPFSILRASKEYE